VEHLLDMMAKRQQALSANIANVDTPGYRAVDFELRNEADSISLSTTNKNHLSPLDSSQSRRFEVQSEVKPNGNSVDFERELTELGKNGLQYITLVQFLNQKIRTLRASINEGGKV
jgi:flagellar basal-body rod protein FlgB